MLTQYLTVVGAHGTLSGLANLCPRLCIKILALFHQSRLEEARTLQAVVANADWLAIQFGFVGVKAVMGMFSPPTGVLQKAEYVLPRAPCKPLTGDALEKMRSGMFAVANLERSHGKQGHAGT